MAAGARRVETAGGALLLLAMLGQVAIGAPQLSPTDDELANAPAGVAMLTQGRTSDFTHPPLPRLVVASGLLAMGARAAESPEALAALDAGRWKVYGREFVFHNTGLATPALVETARLPMMLSAVALAMLVWRVARRWYGAAGGMVALVAATLSPTLLGHARLCTPDVPAALTTFVAAIALVRAVQLRTVRAEAWAGVALGVAMLTKYSAITIVPAAALAGVALWWRRRATLHLRDAVLRPACVVALVTGLVVWTGFGFEVARPADDPMLRDKARAAAMVARVDARLTAYGLSASAILDVPVPAYSFWKGLGTQVAHNFMQDQWMYGSYQYLDGRYSQTGWWRYYPLAFLWKTEGPLLVALAWALARAAARARAARAAGGSWRAALGRIDDGTWMWIAVPSVFALACLTSTINVGHRYLLPLYPFLFVAVGSIAQRWTWPRARDGRAGVQAWAALALGAGLVVTSLSAYPDHLSYFNVLGGGSANGWRRLADSNVDWGQDLWRLRRVLDRVWDGPYFLDVFTSARPDADYGFARAWPLPATRSPEVSGLVVVSVSQLLFKASHDPAPQRAWLLEAEPFARVGDSLFIYWTENGRVVPPPADVRQRFEAAAGLGAKLVVVGAKVEARGSWRTSRVPDSSRVATVPEGLPRLPVEMRRDGRPEPESGPGGAVPRDARGDEEAGTLGPAVPPGQRAERSVATSR